MAGIDLVVTDLDGTFWSVDQQLHPATRAAIDELERRSIPLVIATGRRVRSTQVPLGRLGLAPSAVTLNGAVGLDLSSGERFHRHAFDVAAALAVLAAYQNEGISPVVYVDDPEYDVFVSTSPSTHPEHVEALAPYAGVEALDRVVERLPVLSVGVIGCPAAPLAAVAGRLRGVAETSLDRSLDYPGLFNLMVGPLGLSKWSGVEVFCARAGIDSTRVLAVGDGPNDIELLSNAAIGLAPRDGHASALGAADHLLAPTVDGGWAGLLDFL